MEHFTYGCYRFKAVSLIKPWILISKGTYDFPTPESPISTTYAYEVD
jgi:hypothetical protein